MTPLVGPQLLPIAFNAEIANWGDSVSVPCSILKGDMPMDISWAFNGVPIDTSKDTGITITKISKHLSTLSIDGVSARHAGEYACSASNLAGSVSRSTTLTVNGTILIPVARFPLDIIDLYINIATHLQFLHLSNDPSSLPKNLSTQQIHIPPPYQPHLLIHVI